VQGTAIRQQNAKSSGPFTLSDKKTTLTLWCSPNTPKRTRTDNSPIPPDLNNVYYLMSHAKKAVFFLTFLPGELGKQNIIGEARDLAETRPELIVLGAASDPKALPPQQQPVPQPAKPVIGPDGKEMKVPPPAIWWPNGDQSTIAFIRAAAVRIPIGNLEPELLTAGHAIIHDKIIVIDPLDETDCAVITGSHNLGYKASYANDENLVIIKGNRDLAVAYALHVLDVYDHYVMRARLEEEYRKTLLAGQVPQPDAGHGFLAVDDSWQQHVMSRPNPVQNYFS
jgi:phosphatidylserine/phosphatidylglycerophosphate/cardiolipin synthase-like enzyme